MKLLSISMLSVIGLSGSVRADDLALVGRVLKAPRLDYSKAPRYEKAQQLKTLGDRGLKLLATFLEDYDLGYYAATTMLEIDAERAAPLIFASMPKSCRNVQRYTFQFFIRGARERSEYEFAKEMHDAAVRCLLEDTNADAAVQALLALGLTGGEVDYALLEKFVNNQHSVPVWQKRLRNAAEMALARLGSVDQLDRIAAQLSLEPPDPMTVSAASDLHDAMMKAGFSNSDRFVPLLCRYLSVQGPPATSDVEPHFPAASAGAALEQIVNDVSPTLSYSRTDWKAWWQENESRYTKQPNN